MMQPEKLQKLFLRRKGGNSFEDGKWFCNFVENCLQNKCKKIQKVNLRFKNCTLWFKN